MILGEDVISGDALPFVSERSRSFRFEPGKPRLYLPEITAIPPRPGRHTLSATEPTSGRSTQNWIEVIGL